MESHSRQNQSAKGVSRCCSFRNQVKFFFRTCNSNRTSLTSSLFSFAVLIQVSSNLQALATDIVSMSREEERGDFELREANTRSSDVPATASLPPADGGRAAWFFLLGSFLIETLLWGQSLTSPCTCTCTTGRDSLTISLQAFLSPSAC
jgi:hypothetical protein